MPASTPSRARSSKPHTKKRAASHRLQDIAAWMVDQLDARAAQELRRAFQGGKTLRYGTLCSGTDSPVVVMDRLAKALTKHLRVEVKTEHVFSCEFDPRKQQWIRDNFPNCKQVFADVIDVGLGDGKALNVVSGRREKVPEVDVVIAGFSCKSVSAENNERQKYSSCIDEANGTTGETFSGVEGYVQKYKPRIVICENVVKLTHRIDGQEPQVESVMRSLKACNYSAHWSLLDSHDFQMPQRRPRCWMWAFRGLDGETENVAKVSVLETIKSLKSPTPFKFDAVAGKKGAKVRTLHMNARKKGVVREALRRRKRQAQRRGESTENDDMFVDVAKSSSRCPYNLGATACIVPNSQPYRVKEKRIIGPQEVLAVQGIYSKDFPALDKYAREGKGVLLRDLAGNAFTAPVCMAVTLAGLVHGLMPTRGQKRPAPTRA